MRSGIKLSMTAAVMALLAAPSTLMAQSSTNSSSVFKMFVAPIPNNPDFLDWLGVFQVWFLMLLSVVAMALMIQFYLKYRKANIIPTDTRNQLEQLMNEKRYAEAIQFAQADHSYLSKVARASLTEASNGFGMMERAMEESADTETTRMLRPLESLNILANVAPMIGLFGTVFGMIVAFQRLVDMGGKPDPGALAGGISTALVTTMWGLIIAVPSMVVYAIIRNNIDAATSEGILVVEGLIKPFRPSRKPTAPAGGAAPVPAAGAAPAAPRPRATPKPPEGNPPA
jgi:biopolymer transport protein ExbB